MAAGFYQPTRQNLASLLNNWLSIYNLPLKQTFSFHQHQGCYCCCDLIDRSLSDFQRNGIFSWTAMLIDNMWPKVSKNVLHYRTWHIASTYCSFSQDLSPVCKAELFYEWIQCSSSEILTSYWQLVPKIIPLWWTQVKIQTTHIQAEGEVLISVWIWIAGTISNLSCRQDSHQMVLEVMVRFRCLQGSSQSILACDFMETLFMPLIP